MALNRSRHCREWISCLGGGDPCSLAEDSGEAIFLTASRRRFVLLNRSEPVAIISSTNPRQRSMFLQQTRTGGGPSASIATGSGSYSCLIKESHLDAGGAGAALIKKL